METYLCYGHTLFPTIWSRTFSDLRQYNNVKTLTALHRLPEVTDEAFPLQLAAVVHCVQVG